MAIGNLSIEDKVDINRIDSLIGNDDISSLGGGGGTLTGILNHWNTWQSISRGSYLTTPIIDFCKNDFCRGIVHTFQFSSAYVAPDAPDGGEAHIVKIPDDAGIRWTILFFPYLPNYNSRTFYIGQLWVNNDSIVWNKYDYDELYNRPYVYTSSSAPTSSDGKDGDIWIKH